MTVAALSPSIEYLEDGSTTIFAVPFRFKAPQHLQAVRIFADGSIDVLAYGSDYSALGGSTDGGGSLTVAAAAIAGTRLSIKRVTPRVQSMNYATADTFPAESHEGALDNSMLVDQEQDVAILDLLVRALLMPVGEAAGVLPAAADRANLQLGFDAAGRPIVVNGGGADGTLRVDLATIAGAALVRYGLATVKDKLDSLPLSRSDISLVGFDGATNDAGAWQAAIAQLEARTPTGGVLSVKAGQTRIGTTILCKSDQIFELGQTTVLVEPAGTRGFDIGWAQELQVDVVLFHGGRYLATGAGKTVFAVQNAYAPQFRDIDMRLLSDDMIGFHVRGYVTVMGPYYGVLDNVRIYGHQDVTGCAAIVFEHAGIPGSYGVNRWVMSNIRHIAVVAVGMDLRGVDGLVVNNINFEAITDTAVRFNYAHPTLDPRAVTSDSADGSVINDSGIGALIGTIQSYGAVVVLTGDNAGMSSPAILDWANNRILLDHQLPHPFEAGDTYAYHAAQAINVQIQNATLENAGCAVDFQAGASNCVVQFAMRTQDNADIIFKRGVEDASNTIARRVQTFTFISNPAVNSGELAAGSGTDYLTPVWIAGQRGGVNGLNGGWIDAIRVTGARRSAGQAGTIEIDALVNGVSWGQGKPLLTPSCPWSARRVRTQLMSADLLRDNQALNIVATRTGMATAEAVRVEVDIAYG